MLLHLDQRLTRDRDRRHSSGICFSSYRGYKYILASHFLSILGELELEICDTYVQREIHILWYIQISGARCLRPRRVTEIETFDISFILSRKILQYPGQNSTEPPCSGLLTSVRIRPSVAVRSRLEVVDLAQRAAEAAAEDHADELDEGDAARHGNQIDEVLLRKVDQCVRTALKV